MERHVKRFLSTGDHRALPVVVMGILVAIAPFLLIPSPGDGGPITFAVRLMQVIAAVLGLAVAVTGIYSYRTGNLRPAMVTATTIFGLTIVGVVGGLVEMTGGPLIPIWAWLLAAALVLPASLAVTYRFISGEQG
ncbi:hypothetical protein [Halosolutus halophilus]|uniref:hypothetical protein n=1 Tax=Halosolutus halophilus TaxID=1552990 RepID=UPI0022352571|nr:hypothetical protein [Halosolutus halophilus]